MTRIAILSDIHANAFALRAVLKDLDTKNVDDVLIGGDLVGRGPQGDAVIDIIREKGWRSVRGNHEDYLLNFHHRRIDPAWWEDPVWSASRWMASEISSHNFDYLEALPFSLTTDALPGMLLVHGTPRSNQEGIGEWTTTEVLDACTHELRAGDMLVGAHTHRPIILEHEHVTIVNTGSVGLPFNGDARAQYVIVSRTQDTWSVDFEHVEYDRDAFLAHYKSSGFLQEGGITSAMLYQEIIHARPFLVPYLRWAEATQETLDAASVERFLDFYDCNLTMAELFELFKELGVHV